jgi:FeS assembly protein SufD
MNMPAVNVQAAEGGRPEDAAAQLVAHYRRMAERLPGSAIEAIRQMRDNAMAAFAEQGLPHRRVEEWKYTDLRRFMAEAYAPAASQAALTKAQIDEALGEVARIEAIKLVFVNGHFNEDLSDLIDLPDGVEPMSLAKALYAPAGWLLAALGKVNPQERDPVVLVNSGLATDGMVLSLPPGVSVDRPVHVIHVAVSPEPVSSAIRNVVVAGEGSEATLIESFVTIGETEAQVNSVVELKLGPRAKIRHYKISSENQHTQHLSSAMVELAEKADYLAMDFAGGTSLARHQTFLKFDGDDARGHFYGVQLLSGRQHCDMTLVINHDAVGCESREHVKAILADRAHGVFQAKVMVRPDAQKTDGRQMSQALLLSDEAEFDAKPELEIFADDVKCNHGATFGALDEDLMFYLRARGIPEEEARSLLIQAFVGEVIDQVEHDILRETLMSRVADWLN